MILIGFGSNLPFCGRAPQENVIAAAKALGGIGNIRQLSPLYASPAWPDPRDPAFVNAVGVLETDLAPDALLAALKAVERAFGRRRAPPNAPRTLDLDLLAYNDEVRGGEAGGGEADGGETGGGEAGAGTVAGLRLPHPRLAERDFVLAPLCDVAPDWRHPVLDAGACDLLAAAGTRTARRL